MTNKTEQEKKFIKNHLFKFYLRPTPVASQPQKWKPSTKGEIAANSSTALCNESNFFLIFQSANWGLKWCTRREQKNGGKFALYTSSAWNIDGKWKNMKIRKTPSQRLKIMQLLHDTTVSLFNTRRKLSIPQQSYHLLP